MWENLYRIDHVPVLAETFRDMNDDGDLFAVANFVVKLDLSSMYSSILYWTNGVGDIDSSTW